MLGSILLIALQIGFLLLRAYFDGSHDQKKARDALKEAQDRLDKVALQLQTRVRFENPTHIEVDRVLNALEKAEDENKQ